jgi:hypothetical protein
VELDKTEQEAALVAATRPVAPIDVSKFTATVTASSSGGSLVTFTQTPATDTPA